MKIGIFVCAILSLATSASLIADTGTPAQFAKANQEYAAGDFKAAINEYEELLRAGQDSPNLFYNLGNAYFRQKDFGHAILNYERALALDSRHPEAQANLRIARDEARALELIPSRSEHWLGFATLNQYSIAGAVAFWIGICLMAMFIFNRRRGAVALSILSLATCALSVSAIYQLSHGKSGGGLAIVTVENAEARLATADTANRVLTLPAGSEIQVVSHRGDWIYAALPNNLHGWLPANSAEQVRL